MYSMYVYYFEVIIKISEMAEKGSITEVECLKDVYAYLPLICRHKNYSKKFKVNNLNHFMLTKIILSPA